MNDHFLLEAVWLLFTYGWPSLACGLTISSAMVIWGSRRVRRRSRMAVLAAATFVLWIALVVGIEYGYNAWQSIPNPPDEAFSDTGGVFVMLFLGWVPGGTILGIAHLFLRLCWQQPRTEIPPSRGDAQ